MLNSDYSIRVFIHGKRRKYWGEGNLSTPHISESMSQSLRHVDHYDKSYWDPEFLKGGPVNGGNWELYFQNSLFFDPNSCNAIMIKERGFSDPALLQKEKGIQYKCIWDNFPLLIILKSNRLDETLEHPLAVYYIMNGYIFQAPDMESVLSARVDNCVFFLRQALDALEKEGRRISMENLYGNETDNEGKLVIFEEESYLRQDVENSRFFEVFKATLSTVQAALAEVESKTA